MALVISIALATITVVQEIRDSPQSGTYTVPIQAPPGWTREDFLDAHEARVSRAPWGSEEAHVTPLAYCGESTH